MRSTCCFPSNTDIRPWLDELRRQVHSPAEVEAWQPGSPAADYAVVWQPSQAFFDSQSQLRAIFVAGAGVDAVLSLKLPSRLPILRLEDAGMAPQMAEYVVHAVLRYFREFDGYAIQAAHGYWNERPARSRREFPIGIMGYGILGQYVARALMALDFDVHAWARSGQGTSGVRLFSGTESLTEFLRATRILVCMLPLTTETQDIICRSTLEQLQPGSYFINVARGAHVVENDLLDALNQGHLAGVTLDVCRNEPATPVHPFWQHPNITLTPHIAAVTLCAKAVEQIVMNIDAFERGITVRGMVDRERGY